MNFVITLHTKLFKHLTTGYPRGMGRIGAVIAAVYLIEHIVKSHQLVFGEGAILVYISVYHFCHNLSIKKTILFVSAIQPGFNRLYSHLLYLPFGCIVPTLWNRFFCIYKSIFYFTGRNVLRPYKYQLPI